MNKKNDIYIKIREDILNNTVCVLLRKHFNSSKFAKKLYCMMRLKHASHRCVLCVAVTDSGKFLAERIINCEQTYRPHRLSAILLEFANETDSNKVFLAVRTNKTDEDNLRNNLICDAEVVSYRLQRNGIMLTHFFATGDSSAYDIFNNRSYV